MTEWRQGLTLNTFYSAVNVQDAFFHLKYHYLSAKQAATISAYIDSRTENLKRVVASMID